MAGRRLGRLWSDWTLLVQRTNVCVLRAFAVDGVCGNCYHPWQWAGRHLFQARIVAVGGDDAAPRPIAAVIAAASGAGHGVPGADAAPTLITLAGRAVVGVTVATVPARRPVSRPRYRLMTRHIFRALEPEGILMFALDAIPAMPMVLSAVAAMIPAVRVPCHVLGVSKLLAGLCSRNKQPFAS